MTVKRLPWILSRVVTAALLAVISVAPGYASCGSAFCVLNTSWDMQESAAAAGQTRLDLRYEYIDQKHLRSGNSGISASDSTGDTTEQRTVNRNLLVALDHALSSRWGMSASLPVVDRFHSHIKDPADTAQRETWRFSQVGDARLIGRFQFGPPGTTGNYGLQFGLKLPTGDYRVANAEGTLAERALQPGTGSSDWILGGYYSYRPHHLGPSWFIHGLYQSAFATRDGFRPGDQLSVTGGVRYPFGTGLAGLFQVNALYRRRDSGVNAEPDLSGGEFVFASPGLSYAVTADTQVYGFVQLPLYRYVNGTQLAADASWVVGLSTRF